MPTEKERFEILLEDIRGNIQAIAEGHQFPREELKSGLGELKGEIVALRNEFHLYAESTEMRIGELEKRES
jgi:hypothetical protein